MTPAVMMDVNIKYSCPICGKTKFRSDNLSVYSPKLEVTRPRIAQRCAECKVMPTMDLEFVSFGPGELVLGNMQND